MENEKDRKGKRMEKKTGRREGGGERESDRTKARERES